MTDLRWPAIRWSAAFTAIMECVESRYPGALARLDKHVAPVIIPRAEVQPYHLLVEDEDLKALARSAILEENVRHGRDLRLDVEPDSVLVIAPAQ